jgi:hypothetical protein
MIKRIAVFTAAVTTFALAAMFVGTPAPQAQITISLPFGTQTTLSGASLQIIGTNPTRRSIQICNGTGGVLSVAPVPITPTAAAGVQVPTSTCFSPPPLLTGTSGGAGAAWNGIGSTVVTVLEW